MDTNQVIAMFTVLLTIALASERLIEVAKPLINKIQNVELAASVKIIGAALIGFGLAYLFGYNLLLALGLADIPTVLGYLVTGLVSSVGSSVLHPILEWLKTLSVPVTKIVTTTKSDPLAPTGVTITTTTTPPAVAITPPEEPKS
jgi:hypothetical protein